MIFRALRRLYAWTVGWAARPSASWALFGISFAESSCFPIPPDVLLCALGLGAPRRAWWFATVCTAGSVIGGAVGYGIGLLATDLAHTLLRLFATDATIASVKWQFDANTFLYIAIAGFTPIPYKVFTIAAGIFQVSFPVFMLASIVSRAGRFFMEATILRFFGDRARYILEKRFEWITVAFTVALVGGFLVVKYLF
jgi:membrane protein YqaA with SNARE-associated domain